MALCESEIYRSIPELTLSLIAAFQHNVIPISEHRLFISALKTFTIFWNIITENLNKGLSSESRHCSTSYNANDTLGHLQFTSESDEPMVIQCAKNNTKVLTVIVFYTIRFILKIKMRYWNICLFLALTYMNNLNATPDIRNYILFQFWDSYLISQQ